MTNATTTHDDLVATAVRELELAALRCAEMKTKRLQTEIVQLHARLAALLQEYEELQTPNPMPTIVVELWIAEYLETLRAFNACVQQCETKGSWRSLLTKRDHKQVIRDLHARLDAAQLTLTEGSRSETVAAVDGGATQPPSLKVQLPVVRPLDSEDVRFLLARIADGTDTDDVKPAALRQLRHLTARETYKKQIVEAGGVRLVVARLRHGSDVEKMDAVAILRTLALANTKVKSEITSSGGIQAFVGLARDGIDGLKAQAASLLWSLAFDATSRDAIMEAGGLETLAELVRGGTNDEAENALRALRELIHTENTQTKFLKTGGFRLLADRVREGTQVQKELAMGMLATLVADVDPDAMAEDVSSNLMKVLLGVIRTSTNKQRDQAIGVVHSLIAKSRAAREEFHGGGGRALFINLSNGGSDQEKSVAQIVLEELARSSESEDVQDPAKKSSAVEQATKSARRLTQETIQDNVDVASLIERLRTGTDDVKATALFYLSVFVPDRMANMIAVVKLGAISDLVSLVQLGTLEQKTHAVRVLMGIAETTSLRTTIVAASGVPVLVNCINGQVVGAFSHLEEKKLAALLDSYSPVSYLVEHSVQVLTRIVRGDIALQGAVIRTGVLYPTMILLHKGTSSQKRSAEWLLLRLVKDRNSVSMMLDVLTSALQEDSQVHQEAACRALVVVVKEVISTGMDRNIPNAPVRPLIRCLQKGQQQLKTEALVAMTKLAPWFVSTYASFTDNGAIPTLVDIFRNGTEEQKGLAISVLSELPSGAQSFMDVIENGGVEVVVRLARDGTAEQQSRAGLSFLLHRLTLLKSARERMVKAGAVQALTNLLRNGTWHLKCSSLDMLRALAREEGMPTELKEHRVVASVVELMRSESNEPGLNHGGARLLGALAYATEARAQLVEAGGYEVLVQLIRVGNDRERDLAAKALDATLGHRDVASVEATVMVGAVESLVALARDGTSESQRMHAAGALTGIASFEKYRSDIVDAGGIPVLVHLISAGTDREKFKAVEALIQLSCSDAVCPVIAEAGGVEAVIPCLSSRDEELTARAALLLSNVAYDNASIRSRVANADGIVELVKLVRDGTELQKETAIHALQSNRPP